MSNFFTDGRLGLIAALQGDARIDSRVKTYVEFGPGLQRRHELRPAVCPAMSIVPTDGLERRVANVEREVPQTLRVQVATEGHDVQPCEELTALVLDRVGACNQDRLGLAAEGLTAVQVRAITWAALPDERSARIVWTATLEVELLWRRA